MELKEKFKIIMLGLRGVGKSSLITRFYSNSFNEEYSPTLDDVFSKPIILNNRKIKLGILSEKTRNNRFCWVTEKWRST